MLRHLVAHTQDLYCCLCKLQMLLFVSEHMSVTSTDSCLRLLLYVCASVLSHALLCRRSGLLCL